MIEQTLRQGIDGVEQEEVFKRCLEGIFDAIHIPETAATAELFIREVARAVALADFRCVSKYIVARRRYPGTMLLTFLKALPLLLVRESQSEIKHSQTLLSSVVKDMFAMVDLPDVRPEDIAFLMAEISRRFCAICLEHPWVRKRAGCTGIMIVIMSTPSSQISDTGINDPKAAHAWLDHAYETQFIRTLLHVLKGLPDDLPRDVDIVLDTIIRVLRICNANYDPINLSASTQEKINLLFEIFFAELYNPKIIVRQAAQTCIDVFIGLSGTSLEKVMPHRIRLLNAMYLKPLRTLSFPSQIGVLEAVRYCVSAEPPLPQLHEELVRLLHECLGAADADDLQLLGNRMGLRQVSIEGGKLRVAGINLLTASMAMTDFFANAPNVRQR